MISMSDEEATGNSAPDEDGTQKPSATCIRCMDSYTAFDHKWELDSQNPAVSRSTIYYISKDPIFNSEKPYFMNVPVDPKWAPRIRQTNVSYIQKVVDITDIRGHEELFTLDQQGFALRKLDSSLSYDDYESTDTITSRFYGEVKGFLLTETKATEVLPFDFQVRRRDPSLKPGSRGAPGKAQPFAAVHVDQTRKAAFRRLKYFHPELASRYTEKRFQIINVWKPLTGPVYDSPLALCDYRSVSHEDRVPTDIIFPDYLGETYNLWSNPSHRYYYIDGQQSNEAWMIKCFDSETLRDPSVAQFAPHVSFPYNRAVGDQMHTSTPRESIEVRTFVFYD